MNMQSKKRAKRVAKLIKGYAAESCDVKANIKDVLTDLQHLCDQQAMDFFMLLESAAHHYDMEREI